MKKSGVLLITIVTLFVISGAAIRRSTGLESGSVQVALWERIMPCASVKRALVQAYLAPFSDFVVVDTFGVDPVRRHCQRC